MLRPAEVKSDERRQRDPAGAWLGYDARPAAVKTALAYTLRRLATAASVAASDCETFSGSRWATPMKITSTITSWAIRLDIAP